MESSLWLLTATSTWIPYFFGLAFFLCLTVICFWGHKQTGARGWRLLGYAGVLRLLLQLAWAYPTYALHHEGPARYGQLMIGYGIVNGVVTPVASLLILLGLVYLLRDQRRP